MNRWLVFLILIFVVAQTAFADPRRLEDLLFDATRYANTPARKEAKRQARAELKERMPEALSTAMTYINSDRIMIQVLVMEWVLELPSETIVPVMLDHVDDPNEDTRRIAIYFLGFHAVPEWAERIMPHLDHEKTRGAALRTLGKWKIPAVREPAEKWLAEGNERIRIVTANALRDLGDSAAIPALLRALDDPFFTVRHAAARALVSLGDDAIPSLQVEDEALSMRAAQLRKRCLVDLEQKTARELFGDAPMVLDDRFF